MQLTPHARSERSVRIQPSHHGDEEQRAYDPSPRFPFDRNLGAIGHQRFVGHILVGCRLTQRSEWLAKHHRFNLGELRYRRSVSTLKLQQNILIWARSGQGDHQVGIVTSLTTLKLKIQTRQSVTSPFWSTWPATDSSRRATTAHSPCNNPVHARRTVSTPRCP
jgi:hypothetical protein